MKDQTLKCKDCKHCKFFKSLDDSVVTSSYGLCRILKVAVFKDDEEVCKHSLRKE